MKRPSGDSKKPQSYLGALRPTRFLKSPPKSLRKLWKIICEHLPETLRENLRGFYLDHYGRLIDWLTFPPEYRLPRLGYLLHLHSDMEILKLNRTPLWNWIEKHGPKRILEIGLGTGTNAKQMIKLAGDCEYFCFDNLSRSESLRVYRELGRMPNVRFFVGDTLETLANHADALPKMDLIFIDGAHDYEHVKNDWRYCKRLMDDSTACFFHDLERSGVRRALGDIDKNEFEIKTIRPSVPPTLALVRKKNEVA